MTNMNAPQGNMEPHRGTLILVFGILGLVICVIFGIVAWVMGRGDLEKMRTGMMDPSGEQLTKVGVILGIVSTVLLCVGVAIWIVILILGIAGAGISAAQ